MRGSDRGCRSDASAQAHRDLLCSGWLLLVDGRRRGSVSRFDDRCPMLASVHSVQLGERVPPFSNDPGRLADVVAMRPAGSNWQSLDEPGRTAIGSLHLAVGPGS